MPEDAPGMLTSKRRSELQLALAEVGRIMAGLDMPTEISAASALALPELRQAVLAAGLRTAWSSAWQKASQRPQAASQASPPASEAAAGAIPAALGVGLPSAAATAPTQPSQAISQPQAGPAFIPPAPPQFQPPCPVGQGGGAAAQWLAQQLQQKQLPKGAYQALCKHLRLQRGEYPTAEDCLSLGEEAAAAIAYAREQPRPHGRGSW